MTREVKHKGYKYRIYPNKKQEELINKTFGCVRFVYNKMLENRITIYEKYKENKEELKNQKGTIRIIDNTSIRIPILKDIKTKIHREIPEEYEIKSATISKTKTGKYYISVLVE